MKEFTLPSLGADMDEGMLAAWLVDPGDAVARGQIIAEVETDKGIIEVEIWEDATIAELLVEPGEARLAVGTPIAMIAEAGETLPATAEPHRGGAVVNDEPDEPVPAMLGSEPTAAPAPTATPPVRHLAHQLGVDIASVAGTGAAGAITRDDVRSAAGGNGHRTPTRRRMVTPRARKLASERGIDLGTLEASRPDGILAADDVPSRPDEPATVTTAPVSAPEPTDAAAAMRRAIARSMERSKREIPHYYLGTAVDLAAAMTWLDEVNEDRPVTKRILPATLLLKATALALREHPELNGHWLDGAFHAIDPVHLGVAVSLRGGGLVAPAIHDADTMGLEELMAALADLVARARAGRLRGSEMSQQTCTVTNLGDRGVDRTLPVIIPPQVAIVGFGRIADRPVAADGTVVVHPCVDVSLAADHRVTDGHTGGLFLRTIDRRLQEPDQL